MPSGQDPTEHEWQDLLGMGLGVVILLSPAIAPDEFRISTVLNAAVVGIIVMAVSEFELAGHRVREEATNGAAGLWLVASPFALGYGGQGVLRFWHIALGAVVAILSIAEFLQERRRKPPGPPT
jgi:heme A synthase